MARCIPLAEVASVKNISYKTTSVQKRSAYKKMKVSSDLGFIHCMYSLKGTTFPLPGAQVMVTKQILPYFQPVHDVSSGACVGAEILARLSLSSAEEDTSYFKGENYRLKEKRKQLS